MRDKQQEVVGINMPSKISAITIGIPAQSAARLKGFPWLKINFLLLQPALREHLSRQMAVLPPTMLAQVLKHLSAAVRTIEEIRGLVDVAAPRRFSNRLAFLGDKSSRAQMLVERMRENFALLDAIHPQLAEALALIHDMGKFEPSDNPASPFYRHSAIGYEMVGRFSGALNFNSARSDITAADLTNLAGTVTRFHMAISNYCTGERAPGTFREIFENPVLKPLLLRPEFRKIFFAALLNVTLADVGALGQLSLFKIEQYLAIHDALLAGRFERAKPGDELANSAWRLNQLLAMQDKALDRRSSVDPMHYYHLLERKAGERLGQKGMEALLADLSRIDKLVYFRTFWACLTLGMKPHYDSPSDLHEAGLDFLVAINEQVKRHGVFAHPITVDLPNIPRGRTMRDTVNLLRRPGRLRQLFDDRLGHLSWNSRPDDFGNVSERLQISILDFLARSRRVGKQ